MSEEIVDYKLDDDQEEMVQISKDDWEAIVETIQDLESDEDIDTKIEKTLVNSRVIYLHGEIDESTVQQVVPMIHYYNFSDEGLSELERIPIKIHVASEGGEIHKGLNIVSAIEKSETPVHTISEGTQIASMGFMIYLSGHKRFMSRHSQPLYHQLSGGAGNTLAEMRNMVEYYERLQSDLDNYIVEKTDIPLEKLREYGDRNLDWYISFEECRNYKVFDEEA